VQDEEANSFRQKVVWLIVDNHFNFTKDKTNGRARSYFEISKKGKKTEVRFTHQDWFPNMNVRCLFRCVGSYIKGSLRNLIIKGKGQPNPLKGGYQSQKMSVRIHNFFYSRPNTKGSFSDAINNVRGWWSGEVEGNTDKLGAGSPTCVQTRIVPTKDGFRSRQEGAWHVSDANLVL